MATTPYPFVAQSVLTAAQLNSTFNIPINTQTDSYTLVASDGGKRVIMNKASATTITVDANVFDTGDSVWIQNIGAGICTITAGTATVNTAGSLALAQHGGGSLVFTSASVCTFFPGSGVSYGLATGGSSSSITVGGVNYTLLTFSSDDNLVVSRAGLFDVLILGGGAGAGSANSSTGSGGGGAGSLIGLATTTTLYLDAATYAVDVGAGGAVNVDGLGSYIGSVVGAAGGGRGGRGQAADGAVTVGGNGGSGGGSCFTAIEGESVDKTFGKDGGEGNQTGFTSAGGGGGYSSAGGNAGVGGANNGGSGGDGVDISAWISGATSNVAAGGGGGGTGTGGAAGTGGVAGKTSGTGNNATSPGSGGGGTVNANGGSGSAGRIWVRFKV